MLLLNPRRTRTNMKLLQLVWIFLLTLCGQSATTPITVKEDDEVILNCSFGGTNIEKKPFTWKKDVDKSNEEVFWFSDGQTDPGKEFRGRVSHFPDQLRFGNASIKITKAKTSDNGTYTCYHATVQKEVKSTISLTVGAAPKPIVTVDKTNDEVLLTCEVQGAFPKPVVQWWDSDGNVLAVGDPQLRDGKVNKYDTVLSVTVIKAGFYRCVSTQDDIHHQIYTKTYAPGPGGALQPWATILGENDDGVLLQCVVQGASPELKVSWKNKSGNLVPSKEPQKTENSIILKTTVKKTDYYRCVTTEGKKDDELYSEIYVPVPVSDGAPNGLIIGLLIAGFVIGALVVGTIGVFLWCRYKKQAGGSSTDRSILKNESHSPLKQDV